ncbi:MAG: DUF4328 domain-containing protein [Acidimicrobiales bacterium]
MSDQSGGAGWWEASDGKWYPPELAATPPPPPPPPPPSASGGGAWAQNAGHWPPPSPSPSSSAGPAPLLGDGLVRALQVLMLVGAALSAVVAALAVLSLVRFGQWWTASGWTAWSEFDAWASADDAMSMVALFELLVWIPMVIVLMVWMNKAHKFGAWLNPGWHGWTSGWTVGGWFVPFANFVIPKRVLTDMERRTKSARTKESRPTPDVMSIGTLWWGALVAGLLLDRIGGRLLADALRDEIVPPSTIRWGYGFIAAGFVCATAAGVLGARYFGRFHRELKTAVDPVRL